MDCGGPHEAIQLLIGEIACVCMNLSWRNATNHSKNDCCCTQQVSDDFHKRIREPNSYSLSQLTYSKSLPLSSNLKMNVGREHVNPPRPSSTFRQDRLTRTTKVIPNPKARLLDQVREVLRVKHYALRTEEVYVHWIKRYIFFHQKRHPREMGGSEVQTFLSDRGESKVAASTQNQALNALVFPLRPGPPH